MTPITGNHNKARPNFISRAAPPTRRIISFEQTGSIKNNSLAIKPGLCKDWRSQLLTGVKIQALTNSPLLYFHRATTMNIIPRSSATPEKTESPINPYLSRI